MIITRPVVRTYTPYMVISEAPFSFYLGGSRRMWELHSHKYISERCVHGICIKEDTDFDFYATHSEELEAYLRTHGFANTKTDPGYYDDEALQVLECDNVQVVLRKDAEFYQKCFESIDYEFYAAYLWKQSPSCDRRLIQPYFNQMYSLLHQTGDWKISNGSI